MAVQLKPNQYRVWFTYATVDTGSMAANAVATPSIQIQADSAFEVIKLTSATAIQTTTNTSSIDTMNRTLSVLMYDTGSGAQLSNIAVPIDAMFGTAKQPYVLPCSRVFNPSAVINFTITNTGTTVYTSCILALHGWKIYTM